MITVSDSSPIMNLALIGRLDIINFKFGNILIPETVWKEIVIDGKGKREVEDIESSDWIKVRTVNDKSLVKLLEKDLDKGESEAIVLALESNADIVLLDDKSARLIATNLGLKIIGVIGILMWAKKEGIIKVLSEELDKLRKIANFRLSEDIVIKSLKEVGEVSK